MSTGVSSPVAASALLAGSSSRPAAAAARRRRPVTALTTSSRELAFHDVVRANLRELELIRGDREAGPFVERARRSAGVAPDARRPLIARVIDERVEHGAACAAAACLEHGRHATHAPGSGLAVAADEADGHELLAEKRSNRKGSRRLVLGK